MGAIQKKHGKNRNYPGYQQPGRNGKKQISAWLDADLADAFKEALRAKGLTIQEVFEQLALYVVESEPSVSITTKEKILESDVARYRASRERMLGLDK